jgi:hypothetical protein
MRHVLVRGNAAIVGVGDDTLDSKCASRPRFIRIDGRRAGTYGPQHEIDALQVVRVVVGHAMRKPSDPNRKRIEDVIAPVLSDDFDASVHQAREHAILHRALLELRFNRQRPIARRPFGAGQTSAHIRQMFFRQFRQA